MWSCPAFSDHSGGKPMTGWLLKCIRKQPLDRSRVSPEDIVGIIRKISDCLKR